ncbi:PilZ domain-containing protein [Alkalicoccus chagannorensis]|uniref:PilZ domain-containing protein n=1 Tax=Alkalicoccus chagannorensis TaxID=427072 RepID=UPI000423AAD7|nr:PilZ domain-containing protein [Alkalicoccus chagannorensis]
MSSRRRKEPLRYTFGLPIDTTFYISRVQGESRESKKGKGVLEDLSPGGMRMRTGLNLPDSDYHLTFSFELAGMVIEPVGRIVWKAVKGEQFQYGIDFVSEAYEQDIIRALKSYAREQQ